MPFEKFPGTPFDLVLFELVEMRLLSKMKSAMSDAWEPLRAASNQNVARTTQLVVLANLACVLHEAVAIMLTKATEEKAAQKLGPNEVRKVLPKESLLLAALFIHAHGFVKSSDDPINIAQTMLKNLGHEVPELMPWK